VWLREVSFNTPIFSRMDFPLLMTSLEVGSDTPAVSRTDVPLLVRKLQPYFPRNPCYDQLKTALLKRYQRSVDGFKKRFLLTKPEPEETPTQFLTRIDNYLQRWIELAKAEKTCDGLKTLMV